MLSCKNKSLKFSVDPMKIRNLNKFIFITKHAFLVVKINHLRFL